MTTHALGCVIKLRQKRAGKERSVRYTAILTPGEDGWIVAEVPALPGCISQGQTREEAIRNISDAVAGYLESLRQHGEPIPPEDSIQIQVAA